MADEVACALTFVELLVGQDVGNVLEEVALDAQFPGDGFEGEESVLDVDFDDKRCGVAYSCIADGLMASFNGAQEARRAETKMHTSSHTGLSTVDRLQRTSARRCNQDPVRREEKQVGALHWTKQRQQSEHSKESGPSQITLADYHRAS